MGLNTYPYSPFPCSTEQLHKGDNEQIQAEIDVLRENVSELSDHVDGDATTYPYADVITINDAVPANLADCSVKVEPVQDLHGYDKPWVGGAGKNQCEGYLQATIDSSGTIMSDSAYIVHYGKIKSGQTYTVSNIYDTSGKLVYGIFANVPQIGDTAIGGRVVADSFTFTATSDGYIVFRSNFDHTNGMLEEGTTASTYEPYANICPINGHTEAVVTVADDDTDPTVTNTYTLALGDTIYGGTVDFKTGVMTVDRRFVEYTDGTGWQRASSDAGAWFFCYPSGCVANSINLITDKFVAAYAHTGVYNTAWINFNQLHIKPDANIAPSGSTAEGLEEFKTWLSNNHLQVVYPLATPFTVQLTPEQIQLLQGTNTLYASTGDISVTVNGVSGAIGAVQTQANATDSALAQLAADIAEQLPTAPTTDGAYVLTVTVADGAATYSWESAE